MATTTGFNTTAQADAILPALRAELLPLGLARIGRGRLWILPNRPCCVLVGPLSIEPIGGGIHIEEARWTWAVVIARDAEDEENRSDELDTWADAALAALVDVSYTSSVFENLGFAEGPERQDTHPYALELARAHRDVDATVILLYTRTYIKPPC